MARVLVIGDTHAPFTLDGYVDHLKKMYKKHKCTEVVHIGDVIDGHYSSFHVSDPDGMGGGTELEAAIKQVAELYKAFPHATVILGNHDRIVTRKAKMANLPSKWVRDYNDVLETPNWEWKIDHQIDGVLYQHGEGGTARTMMKHYGMSIVQGHRHSEMYIEYLHTVGGSHFGMQVGCGVDRSSYAMEYARAYKPQALGCGIVIDGEVAILEPFKPDNDA